MRILIAGTANYPASNGQAVFTQNLTEGLARLGHEVVSVLPSETGSPYSATRSMVRIEALKSANLNRIRSNVYFSLFSEGAIQRIFESFGPEIVHVQDHYPLSRDVVQVAQRRRIRLIGTNHFMPENLAAYVPVISRVSPVYRRMMWKWMLEVYNRLDLATAQSHAAAALLRAQGLHVPVYPVSCGIDLKRFRPDPGVDRRAIRLRYGLDPERTVVLFVGRVDREKRLDVLLEALYLLPRDDIQLAIAGRGAADKGLQALADRLNLGDRVRFTGFVPGEDLPALLNSADLFAMPSEAELLSIATLEAMACGRPVLLANAVALPELASDGVNGYLFRPGDAADAARCLALFADDPASWRQMGLASLERARHHGMESTVERYETLYKGLLDGAYTATTDGDRGLGQTYSARA